MSSSLIGIYGASGFGKEVFPLVREHILTNKLDAEICFVDDNPKSKKLLGVNILSYNEFIAFPYALKQVVIAIGNGKIREKLVVKLKGDAVEQLSIYASNIVIMDEVKIDEGGIISPFVTLTSDIKIGKCFHANIYSYVAHDCVVGDYVTFAPRVMCNGNVHVHDHAYIGTGAILKQGTPEKPLVIGEGAVVGMGAVVTKDVPPNSTVVGNPAKPLLKNK